MPRFDFSPFAAVLLDLDGTLSHEEHAMPGAVELVRHFESSGTKYAVLSNTTASPRKIAGQLSRMGMAIVEKHIYTAAAAAADHVLEAFKGVPRVFNLATAGIAELLEGKVRWVESGDEPCDVVICGAPANRFAGLDRQRIALKLLRNGAALVGICADRVYTSPRGLEIGVGALSRMFEYGAGITATFAGKPNRLFFDHLCQKLGVAPERCILIGDNLESDVAGAMGAGMKTILPLTGVTQREDLERLAEGRRPNWVVKDLTELL
ncbi:MAG TPA: HAD-IA family hydrolase [Tepidisphaeraceae bacterium]|jgi:4-nitrophenyl phosphatase